MCGCLINTNYIKYPNVLFKRVLKIPSYFSEMTKSELRLSAARLDSGSVRGFCLPPPQSLPADCCHFNLFHLTSVMIKPAQTTSPHSETNFGLAVKSPYQLSSRRTPEVPSTGVNWWNLIGPMRRSSWLNQTVAACSQSGATLKGSPPADVRQSAPPVQSCRCAAPDLRTRRRRCRSLSSTCCRNYIDWSSSP